MKEIKQIALTFVHWTLVVLVSIVSFVLQYAFKIHIREMGEGAIFAGSVYRINLVTFPLGTALFLVGFYLIWKKWLLADWKAFRGSAWVWKVAYAFIAVLAEVAIFVSGVLIGFLNLGIGSYLRPEWATWGCLAFPLYVALVILYEVYKKFV